MKLASTIFLLLTCSNLFCQTVTAAGDKPTTPKLSDVNPELLQLAIQDQWDRGNDMFGNRQVKDPATLDLKKISEHDEQRHGQVRSLLAEGRIQTGYEYNLAALIFQHSGKPDELILAHVLAVTAVGKGYSTGRYMAAATMDRFLIKIKQSQVFGTQFFRGPGDENWTMEPYDRSILSDSERAIWCVVPVGEQDRILKKAQGNSPSSTQTADCK